MKCSLIDKTNRKCESRELTKTSTRLNVILLSLNLVFITDRNIYCKYAFLQIPQLLWLTSYLYKKELSHLCHPLRCVMLFRGHTVEI